MTAQTELPAQLDFALFDFDGVVADTEPLYVELDRQALRHFGYDPTDEEVLSFVGHPSEVLAPELLARHGIDVTTEQYLEVWDADEMIYGSPDLAPSPGLPELWDELVAHGVRVGVVSTSPCASLVRALDRFRLLSHVSVLVGRELVRERKPSPEPYETALAYLAPGDPDAAARALAVEDSRAGITAARAAGIFTVQYLGAASAERAAGEAAGACAFAGSMAEIARMLRRG